VVVPALALADKEMAIMAADRMLSCLFMLFPLEVNGLCRIGSQPKVNKA
jgi:hypothetical protein